MYHELSSSDFYHAVNKTYHKQPAIVTLLALNEYDQSLYDGNNLPKRFARQTPGTKYLASDIETLAREIAFRSGLGKTGKYLDLPETHWIVKVNIAVQGKIATLRTAVDDVDCAFEFRNQAGVSCEECLHPEAGYEPSWKAAECLAREVSVEGIEYPSVRHPGGKCLALYRDSGPPIEEAVIVN